MLGIKSLNFSIEFFFFNSSSFGIPQRLLML